MKRFFFVIFLPLITGMLYIALPACKKVSGPANGNSVQQNNNLDSTVSANASINGTNWQTDSVFGHYVNFSGNDSGVVALEITGTQYHHDTLSTIVFYITNYTGPNTYAINPPINTATYYSNGNNRNFADTGTIIVTSDTAYSLKGTFYFRTVTSTDTFIVSNGVFNVALP